MQTWGIDTTALAVDQRPWYAAGSLGREDEAISLKRYWVFSGYVADMAKACDSNSDSDSNIAVSDKKEYLRSRG